MRNITLPPSGGAEAEERHASAAERQATLHHGYRGDNARIFVLRVLFRSQPDKPGPIALFLTKRSLNSARTTSARDQLREHHLSKSLYRCFLKPSALGLHSKLNKHAKHNTTTINSHAAHFALIYTVFLKYTNTLARKYCILPVTVFPVTCRVREVWRSLPLTTPAAVLCQ